MTDSEHYSRNGFLTSRGYREVEQRSLEGLEIQGVDRSQVSLYLDKVGSVSAMVEVEDHWLDDEDLNEQYRRFLDHGC